MLTLTAIQCVCVRVCGGGHVCHLQQVEVIITVWCPSRLSTHVWLYTHLAVAPGNRKPSVCPLYYTLYWTHHSATVTQTQTHSRRHTHAGRDTYKWTQCDRNTYSHPHGPADTRITYTLPAAALVQTYTLSLAHNRRLTLEMKLIHHLEHSHTHTHTAGIVTFTAHLPSSWHPCLLDTVAAVMNSYKYTHTHTPMHKHHIEDQRKA